MDDVLSLALQHGLTDLQLDAYRVDGAVRFRRWPTIALSVGGVSVVEKQDAVLLHADITFAYNAARPDSELRTCVTGIGSDLEQARIDAATDWIRSWAPPLISVLNSGPSLGAEWFPAAGPDGVPGWDAFSSPYILRRSQQESASLVRTLETTPLLGLVRDDLPRHLDPSRLLHTVALFVGGMGEATYSEVQIDGAIVSDIGPRLAALPRWDAQWATARQCLVLINATAASGA
jgi:hypothetical protein